MKLMRAEVMACHWGCLLILIIVSTPLTKEIGVDLSCPEIFNDGENNITCTINKTAIQNAGCFTVQNSVSFDVTIDNAAATDCIVAYDIPEICAKNPNDAKCWCDKSEGDIYVYKLSFDANIVKHQHAQLECKLCVTPEYDLSITTSGSCHNFKFHNDGHGSHVTLVLTAGPQLQPAPPAGQGTGPVDGQHNIAPAQWAGCSVGQHKQSEISPNAGVHMITGLTPTVFGTFFLSFILENS